MRVNAIIFLTVFILAHFVKDYYVYIDVRENVDQCEAKYKTQCGTRAMPTYMYSDR